MLALRSDGLLGFVEQLTIHFGLFKLVLSPKFTHPGKTSYKIAKAALKEKFTATFIVCVLVVFYAHLPRLFLQVSDLVSNDRQFVASVGFCKIISLKNIYTYIF